MSAISEGARPSIFRQQVVSCLDEGAVAGKYPASPTLNPFKLVPRQRLNSFRFYVESFELK